MNKSQIRNEQFPVTRNLTYLNHAAVGPLSTLACRAMEDQARQQRDFGAYHWRDWYAEYPKFRQAAATLIGAHSAEISILKNTSEGISFVAEGLRWQEGDNVVTTDMEFPSNCVPWKRLERRGVECRLIRSRDGTFTIDDLERLVDEKTRIVSLSSVSFHNGFAPDLVAIGKLCAARRTLFCVDAIQSLGAIRIDVRKAGIHFLAADAHKWLLGPEGTAVFFCADEVRDELDVLESGWMNVDRRGKFIGSPTDLFNDGRRFEAGSLNTIGIYGVRAAMDLLLGLGMEAVEREVLTMTRLLAERLEGLGFTVRTPRPIASGILAVTPPPVDLDRLEGQVRTPAGDISENVREIVLLHRWLEDQKVICAPREGMLRFSPHFYNDESDVERVVDVLRRVV